MKKKLVIFGAGQNFIHLFRILLPMFEIVAVVDNSSKRQGEIVCGFIVDKPEIMLSLQFDTLLITPNDNAGIEDKLLEMGIPKKKIIRYDDIYDSLTVGGNIRMAIIFYGGLGDMLIGKNWMQYLMDVYGLGSASLDLFFESRDYRNGELIFGNDISWTIYDLTSVSNPLHENGKYDVILQFQIVPYVQYFNGERLAGINERFLEYILELQSYGFHHYRPGFCHNPSFYKTIRTVFDDFPAKNYYSFCDLFDNLGIEEKFIINLPISIDENAYLQEIGLYGKKYITLNTGRHKDFLDKDSTRAWSHEHWNRLAILLRNRHEDIVTVQIGAKTADFDDINADLHLNGKTDFEQVKVLLKNAMLHIDYDSGLVHVRHAIGGGTSIVLLGPLSVRQHCYSENICIRTQACPSACEWMTKKWLFQCPRGMNPPLCMESITPEMVFDAVENFLAGQSDGDVSHE